MPMLDVWVEVEHKLNHKRYLYGEIYNDNRFESGHHVITSEIVEFNREEKTAKTKSGTVYTLKNPMTEADITEKIRWQWDMLYVQPIFNS